MNEKLMSYNQEDFPTKFHMEAQINRVQEITKNEELKGKLKEAGLVKYTMTQVWNKQGKFRLGHYWSYKDEKAFISCQKILNQMAQDNENTSILQADRGIVLLQIE